MWETYENTIYIISKIDFYDSAFSNIDKTCEKGYTYY